MDHAKAIEDVLLGASMRQVAIAYRESLIEAFGFRPEELGPTTFLKETDDFMKTVARRLGDRHRGDGRVQHALQEWILQCDHYEAWDALLAGFEFPGKAALVRRGKMRFPGPLTAHWDGAGD
jgi:hypothetical protein